MKNLIIIGARGFGREVYNCALGCIGYGEDFVVKGFLDDKADALDTTPGYPPILDSVEDYMIQPDDVFICALGDVRYKRKYVEIILAKDGEFYSLIHKDASISQNTLLGKGCIVSPYVIISCDVVVGDFVTFQSFSIIGHDAKIGSYTGFGAHTFAGGYAEIEDMVTIHTGAIILPHIKVGHGALVGAGSVVIRKVKPETTVYGNPATLLKY